VSEQVKPLEKASPVAADARVLESALDSERSAALRRARNTLDGKRYRTLGLRTALWLADGKWARNAALAARRRCAIRRFSIAVLRKRSKNILKQARIAEELDAAARHDLRIRVKELRYAAEFFAAVLARAKHGKRRKRFLKALKRLQSHLGTLNDFEVQKHMARSVARSHVRSPTQPRKALAMGFIAGQEQARVDACITGLNEASRELSRHRKFWK
jgi:CHAD domain-containing protein